MKTDDQTAALSAYEEHPLADGDVVLLLDDRVCLELEGLADQWQDDDGPLLASVLGEAGTRVMPCVARAGCELRGSDRRLWALLQTAGAERGLEVLPLQVLPAAHVAA